MRGLSRSGCLVAAFACARALVACGGGDGGAADVDALTGCLEDAGLKVESNDVGQDEADKGITDELSASSSAGASPGGQVQMAVFESADDAKKYLSGFSGSLKQVDSVLIFALDTESDDYKQSVSCAESSS